MLLAQTWPIVRIKQMESDFIISVDVVTLWLIIGFSSSVYCYDSSNATVVVPWGSTTSPKRNRRPNVLGKCCFNLTFSWFLVCTLHAFTRLCFFADQLPVHRPSTQGFYLWVCWAPPSTVWPRRRWLCRPHWRLWVHFSGTTQGPGLSPFHLLVCPLGGWFLISTFDVWGRKEQLDRLSIGSWFPWEKAVLFLDVLLPGQCLHFLFAYSPYFTRERYTHMQLKLYKASGSVCGCFPTSPHATYM